MIKKEDITKKLKEFEKNNYIKLTIDVNEKIYNKLDEMSKELSVSKGDLLLFAFIKENNL